MMRAEGADNEWIAVGHADDTPEDAVSGTVFEITEQELAAADKYEEVAEYRRISVTLRSGDEAWVYVRA